MDPITGGVLSYLISLAAGFRTDAWLKKEAEKRQQALAKIEITQKIQLFQDEHLLVGEMKTLDHQLVAETKQIAELPEEAKALLDLFAEPAFLHDLARWLVMWDIEEGAQAQRALEFRMLVVLKQNGANPEYIDRIKTTYFALAAQEMSRNPVVANWRHQLALNVLHQKVEQILQFAKKQAGQYSPEQRQQAFDHYRELSLDICDILDLAGLPEDDRHLATQKFILRQFYVPLRLNVEMPKEADISLDQLEQLELRREKQRLYAAGRLRDDEQADDLQRVSIGERLNAAQRLVVLGDPGAGKTTLLRWLVTAYLLKMKADPDLAQLPDVATLPDQDWLPILIRCRELDDSCFTGTLDDILRQTLRKAQMTEQEAAILLAVLREQLAKGQALLLLDGLDEITEATTRARFCRQIESIAVAYPATPIITTSRIVGYREMPLRLRDFEHATVTELSKADKDEFARRWCLATEAKKSKAEQEKITEELIKAIHSSDRIERLSGNPMLLTTLALVKRKVGKLPNRRADLYYEAVQVLLNWRFEVDEPIDKREAIPQLEYVAYEMCRRGVQRLREDEILELLDNVRNDYPNIRPLKQHSAEEFLHLLERRTSILVEAGTVRHNGQPVPVFEFRHLTFQEYLAGLALVDGRFPGHDKSRSLAERIAPLAGQTKLTKEFEKEEHAVSENWREALRLCISCCNDDDVDEALDAIVTPLKHEDATITARPRAILAASCLADEPNVSEEMALKVLQKLVGQVQERDGAGPVFNNTSLCSVTKELACSEWIEHLQAMLINEFCQCDAKNRSKFGGLCATVGGILVSLEPDSLTQWFEHAVVQLNSNNEAKAIEKALTIIAIAFAFSDFIKKQFSENNISFLNTFSESTASKLAHSLVNMLNRTAPSAHAAAWALSWLAARSRRKKWGDAIYGIRSSILIFILTEENIAKILKIISVPNFDSEATVSLISILGSAKYSPAMELLIAKLDDDDLEVRKAAIQALGEIKDSRAVKPLIAKLDDDDSRVRSKGLGALAKICRDEADQKLLSKYFNVGVGYFSFYLDPRNPITEERVAEAASTLKLTQEEVRQRYEDLARAFHLTLAWTSTTD